MELCGGILKDTTAFNLKVLSMHTYYRCSEVGILQEDGVSNIAKEEIYE